MYVRNAVGKVLRTYICLESVFFRTIVTAGAPVRGLYLILSAARTIASSASMA